MMARIYPRQLLVLFSLVSSSCSFLMRSSSTQLRHSSSSRLRHSRETAVSQPFNVLESFSDYSNLHGLRNASEVQFRRDVSNVLSSASRQDGERHLKNFDHVRRKFYDFPGDSIDNHDALRYISHQFDDSFSEMRKGGKTGKFVLESVSWNSRIPSERTWKRHSKLTDGGSRRPGSFSLNTKSDSHRGRKKSLQWLSKHLDKLDVLNKKLNEEIVEESKLWSSLKKLEATLQKLSAENDYWLWKLDRSEDNIQSSINLEPKSEHSDGLDYLDGNLQTSVHEHLFDDTTPSSVVTDQQWPRLLDSKTDQQSSYTETDEQWLKSLYNSPFLHPHEDFIQTEDNAYEHGVPITKRFRVPPHKKVFVYGQDDRLRVFLPQMRKFPFSNIARLSTGCTGTLVTPRHVLTAAHCVHNGVGFRNNLEKLKIEIPDTMGFKDYYAQKITIPTGWLRENRSVRGRQSGKRAVYDYAVVRLKLAVTGRTKFLPLAVPRPEVLQMDFHFLAFPQDDQQLWRSVCLPSQHMALGDGNLIMTRCDAAVGNSGAAVFIQDPHGGLRVVGILSNTMHVSHHRSFFRYSIITALTWPKLTDICNELGLLGRKYNVCPPVRFMRRTPYPPKIKVIPFFGKRSGSRREEPSLGREVQQLWL